MTYEAQKSYFRGGVKYAATACFLFLIHILSSGTAALAQDGLSAAGETANKKSKAVSYLLYDTYIVAGLNTGGIYYSNEFRELSRRPGFHMGLEQYIPMKRIMFLSAGLHYSQRNFQHRVSSQVNFISHYLDVPLYASFELPILKDFDMRFMLGVQAGVRLSSTQKGAYGEAYLADDARFVYSTSDFQRIDGGWSFGVSFERANFMLKLRSYMGFFKVDVKDQGMMHTLNLDVGYFIFRPIKKL